MKEPNYILIRKRLLQEGVAPKHVRRTVAELRDHYADLHEEAVRQGCTIQEAARAATKRLGSEDDLVAEVVAKPELRSWSSRWPWVIYGLGPIAVFVLVVFVIILITSAPIWLERTLTGARYIPPITVQMGIDFVFLGVVYVAPLLIAILALRIALLRHASLTWPMIGSIFLCIFAGAFDVGVHWPTIVDGPASLEIGFAYAPPFPSPLKTGLQSLGNVTFVLIFFFLYGRRIEESSSA